MSGSSALSDSPFSDAEKADVRRFCGYPPYGAGAEGFQSWRFFQAYGLLEYRLNNMAAAEVQNIRLKLANLYPIETALAGAYATMNIGSAGPFTRNPNEMRERRMHFGYWRRDLAAGLGVPPGPDLDAGAVRMVL